ncbi:MAG: PASTA domain-containing protein [Candidatus Babeliales bacterium]|nr:PASTA domain-containing protein [Candidatus Babeliales bacterium]
MIKTLKKTLWIIPFLCFIAGYLALDTLYHQPDIETPTLVGKTIGQAFTILSRNNLNARLLTYKEDPIVQEGTIMSQIPAPSQKIKQNQSVFLVVSTLPQKIKAPNLLSQSLENIQEITKKDKINLKSFRINSNYPENQCFAQKPSPGQSLDGDTVTVYVSAGMPKVVLIPNLKNKPLDQVLEFLKTYSVTTDIVHPHNIDAYHTCNNCIISDQRPLAGSIITLNTSKPLHMQLQVHSRD